MELPGLGWHCSERACKQLGEGRPREGSRGWGPRRGLGWLSPSGGTHEGRVACALGRTGLRTPGLLGQPGSVRGRQVPVLLRYPPPPAGLVEGQRRSPARPVHAWCYAVKRRLLKNKNTFEPGLWVCVDSELLADALLSAPAVEELLSCLCLC